MVTKKADNTAEKSTEKENDGAGFAMPKNQRKVAEKPKSETDEKTPVNPFTPDPAKQEKSHDNSALLAFISGIAVFGYHAGIAIIQPNQVTIWWYASIIPIIFGFSGFKSKDRKWMAISGMALGVLSIVIAILLFTTIYELR